MVNTEEANKGITFTKQKFEIEELTPEEIKHLTSEENKEYERELTEGRQARVTKPTPDGFKLKFKSIYNADEQISLFNSKNWYTQSLKMNPKPYWEGSFTKPYYTYRNDLEMRYLWEQISKKTEKDESLKEVVEKLEEEIGKDPDNKEQLKAILETIKTPEWGKFFETYLIGDEDKKKAWKASGLSALRLHPKAPSEVERAIRNGWEDPTQIDDGLIATYKSHEVTTKDIDPLRVDKQELDRTHRILSKIDKITELENIDKNSWEEILQKLDRNKLPLEYPGVVRIERANKISSLRDKDDTLKDLRNELLEWVMDNLKTYSNPDYKFPQIKQNWQQFGKFRGQWGNENGYDWLDYISKIDEESTHPFIGSKTIETNIKRTFSEFILNQLLNYPHFTKKERKELIQDWVDNNKSEAWDIELLSDPELRAKLLEPKYGLEIEGLPDAEEKFEPFESPEKDWSEIDRAFAEFPNLVESWKDAGFGYKDTKEWIEAGLETGEFELAYWLYNTKRLDAEDLEGKVDELREEYEKLKKGSGSSSLSDKQTKLYNHLRGIVDKYKFNSIVDENGKSVDYHSKKAGYYHCEKSNWAEEVRNIKGETDNENPKDFRDVRDALLQAFASFFVSSVLNNIDLGDDEKKEKIEEYMKEHCSSKEIEIYNKRKTNIETTGAVIPTEAKEIPL